MMPSEEKLQKNTIKSGERLEGKQEPLRVNGMAQVLEMLRIAEPAFRESLLKRLASRDPKLAATLRKDLRKG